MASCAPVRASRWAQLLAGLLSVAAVAEELAVSVTPGQLQLGVDRSAEVEVRGPAELSEVVITVNHGRVGQVRRISPGRFAAEYSVPGQTFPRVAIIAAVGRAGAEVFHGWARLPLWGSAQAQLETAALASISLLIGTRTFAVQADARGHATVPVVVPPGVRVGRFGSRVLDLGLPRVGVTLLVMDSAELAIVGEHRQRVRLYAVTEDGAPRAGLKVIARATRGEVSAFEPGAPGVYLAWWTIPAGEPGDVELSTWTAAEPDALTTAHLLVLPGPPAALKLTVEPPQRVAGDAGDVRLRVEVYDANGYLTRGLPEFQTSLGVISPLVATGEGQWRASLRVPDDFKGATEVLLRAQLKGAPAAAAVLGLRAGAATAIRVRPPRLTMVGDGTGRAEVEVELPDAHGNPARGEVTVTTTAGAMERIATPERASGARYQYVAPRRAQGGEVAVELVSGELRAELPIALTAPMSSLTLAPKLGFLTNFGNANAPTLGAELMYWWAASFGVGVEAGYFFLPRTSRVASGPLAGTTSRLAVHGAPLWVAASWRTELMRVLPFRVTFAAGMTSLGSVLTLENQQPVNETGLSPSLRLAVSLGVPLGNGAAFVELAGGWTALLGTHNAMGPLWLLGLAVGYRFDLL